MKKFVLKIFLFIVFAIPTYILCVYLFGRYVSRDYIENIRYVRGGYGYTCTRLKEVKHIENVDILFLGSSHAYRGFDTRIFKENGYSCFNLGSSSQTPIQTRMLLGKYLDQLNPELVVFEVYPAVFCLDGVESSFDVISNDYVDVNTLKMLPKVPNAKILNTCAYTFVNNIFHPLDEFEEWNNEQDTYVPGGFVEKKMIYYRGNSWERNNIKSWKMDANQFDAFESCLSLFEKRDIEVILVFAPISNDLYQSYDNIPEFEKKIKSYGLEYYNLNGVIPVVDTLHFMDTHHLNQKGVELFNEKLLEILSLN